ncbi:hypothetical protein M9980_04760 [Sphingomonas donggukensis]|uniref:Uncharacterized protein n=1 Tax=Sphingomonas donggukensis TaxID=2949093 RepID=A0ABY4TVX6_9SPHN|nr:hypothetical protein [Sphingomonas donggukensis]URW76532.1 hypothetical protein M9980_04760 [Sphingomonas donggukensis]
MKLFLVAAIVVLVADMFANHGRIVATMILMLMAFGHVASGMAEALLP